MGKTLVLLTVLVCFLSTPASSIRADSMMLQRSERQVAGGGDAAAGGGGDAAAGSGTTTTAAAGSGSGSGTTTAAAGSGGTDAAAGSGGTAASGSGSDAGGSGGAPAGGSGAPGGPGGGEGSGASGSDAGSGNAGAGGGSGSGDAGPPAAGADSTPADGSAEAGAKAGKNDAQPEAAPVKSKLSDAEARKMADDLSQRIAVLRSKLDGLSGDRKNQLSQKIAELQSRLDKLKAAHGIIGRSGLAITARDRAIMQIVKTLKIRAAKARAEARAMMKTTHQVTPAQVASHMFQSGLAENPGNKLLYSRLPTAHAGTVQKQDLTDAKTQIGEAGEAHHDFKTGVGKTVDQLLALDADNTPAGVQ